MKRRMKKKNERGGRIMRKDKRRWRIKERMVDEGERENRVDEG